MKYEVAYKVICNSLSEELPPRDTLLSFASGFSCKSLSKLQNDVASFQRAMSERNQDQQLWMLLGCKLLHDPWLFDQSCCNHSGSSKLIARLNTMNGHYDYEYTTTTRLAFDILICKLCKAVNTAK